MENIYLFAKLFVSEKIFLAFLVSSSLTIKGSTLKKVFKMFLFLLFLAVFALCRLILLSRHCANHGSALSSLSS